MFDIILSLALYQNLVFTFILYILNLIHFIFILKLIYIK